MPNPLCEVKDGAGSFQSTANGATITPGNVITVRLANPAGVNVWVLRIFGTDEQTDKSTIPVAIDMVTKSATFTAPAGPGVARSILFESQVENGKNAQNKPDPAMTATFGCYFPTGSGHRVLATNERMESNAVYGWITSLNAIIRNPTAFPAWVSGPFGIGGAALAGTQLTVQGAGGFALTPSAQAGATPIGFRYTGPAHTTMVAATEFTDFDVNMQRTIQWSTGAIATQRAVRFRQPTYAFIGASVVTRAATVAIGGAPAAGANATITNSWAFWVQAGASRFDGMLQVQGQTVALQLSRPLNDGTAAQIRFIKMRGASEDAPAAVQSGDELGFITAIGVDDSLTANANNAAAMGFSAEENFLTTNRGTRWVLQLTPIGSVTRSEALRVDGSGRITAKSAVDRLLTAGTKTIFGTTATDVFCFCDTSYAQQAATVRMGPSTALYMGLGSTLYMGYDSSGVLLGINGQNIAMGSSNAGGWGGGVGIQHHAYATTAPTTSPTNGNFYYQDPADGYPKYRRTDGSILTIDQNDPSTNGFRLTASTGNPVPTADVATSTSIFLSPYTHGTIKLYDGAAWRTRTSSVDITLALGTLTSGKNYDVFAYWTGAAIALELSAAWSTDTARTDAIARQDGILVKSGTPTRRFLGTIRTISTTQITDTATQRFVWNMYNTVERVLSIHDATNNWTYVNPNSVFRQVRSTASNRVEVICGAPTPIELIAQLPSTSTANALFTTGVGIDSTTVNSAQLFGAQVGATGTSTVVSTSRYAGLVALGYHAYNWLETGVANSQTYTFYGNFGFAAIVRSGMLGSIAA